MSSLETPELGDVVEWGEPVYGQFGLICDSPRGTVEHVYKNGSILVVPDSGEKKIKFNPGSFTILSKAG